MRVDAAIEHGIFFARQANCDCVLLPGSLIIQVHMYCCTGIRTYIHTKVPGIVIFDLNSSSIFIPGGSRNHVFLIDCTFAHKYNIHVCTNRAGYM